MTTRTLVSQLSLMSLLLLLAASCGTGGGGPGQPPVMEVPTATPVRGTGTITFLTLYIDDEFSARVDEWAADFMERVPTVEVQVETLAEAELRDRLAGAEVLPDVMLVPAEYLAGLVARDLLDTEAPGAMVEQVGANKFYPVPLAQVQAEDGTLLGIPYYSAVQGIWYRKDLFEQEGLDAPRSPDAIVAAAQALHVEGEAMYGMALPAASESVAAHHALAHLAQAAGAHVVSDDGTPQFTDEAFVSALQAYADLSAVSVPAETTIVEARDLFLDEQLAIILDSTSLLSQLGDRYQGDVKAEEIARKMDFVSALGDGAEGVSYAYTLALAVGQGASSDVVMAWLDYLLDPSKAYIIYWVPPGWAPAMSTVAFQWRAQKAHDWFGYYEAGMPEDLLDGLRKAPGWGVGSDAAAVMLSRIYAAGLFSQAVEKIQSGEMDAQGVAAWLQEEAGKLQK